MGELEKITGRIVRYDPQKLARDRARVEQWFWPKIRRGLGRISFLEEAVTAYYCAIDPNTPLKAKAALMGALAYFAVPSALLPRIFSLVRFVDSGRVLGYAMREFGDHIQPHHRERAQRTLAKLRDEEDGDDAEHPPA